MERQQQLAKERLQQIADLLQDAPDGMRPADIGERLGLSRETVRRGLLELERQGLVQRTHGRVVSHGHEHPFRQRRQQHRPTKRAIGRSAAKRIVSGSTIVLDVGTTVAELASLLGPAFQGRVLTNSLLAAAELADRPDVEVLTSGGRVRGGDLACSGPTTEQFFAKWFADQAFLGSGGVDAKAGLTDFWEPEAVVRQVMLTHAKERFVLADSSKLGRVAPVQVCALAELTAIITDDQLDPHVHRTLKDAGVQLVIAPTVEEP